MNNWGLTELVNLVGFHGDKSHYYEGVWDTITLAHFLVGGTGFVIRTAGYRENLLGYCSNQNTSVSSAFNPYSHVNYRYWGRGGRGSSITQQH